MFFNVSGTKGVVFSKCRMSNGNGGAILAENSEVTVLNCFFEDNRGPAILATQGSKIHVEGMVARGNWGAGIEIRANSDNCAVAAVHLEKLEDLELKQELLKILQKLANEKIHVRKQGLYDKIVSKLADHVSILTPIVKVLSPWVSQSG